MMKYSDKSYETKKIHNGKSFRQKELPTVKVRLACPRNTSKEAMVPQVEKAREFQKTVYFCFIDYTKAFDCVDHNKVWKILQEMGIPDTLPAS